MKFLKPVLYILALSILGYIFFYKLGANPLQSYDEAWYASIANNIIESHNPLELTFNEKVFTDHPPMGFWLISITTLIFGNNEFGARSATAILGVGTVVIVYLIGWQIKNKAVGVAAALMLLSSVWFITRARSANLDVQFTFWQMLTLYSLLRIKENTRFIFLMTFSFAALFLTKTLVGLGIFPVVLFGLWMNRKLLTPKLILKNILLFSVMVLLWYVYNAVLDKRFLHHHFVEVAGRGDTNSYKLESLKSSMNYLRIGVGRWFKIMIAAVLATPILVFLKRKTWTTVVYLLLAFLGFAIPFLLSYKTEVWHLIPLYAPLCLIAAYVTQQFIEVIFPKKPMLFIGVVVLFGVLAVYQFNQFSNLVFAVGTPYSAERDVLIQAKKYPKLYIMEPFLPAAVYYADTYVESFHLSTQAYQDMSALMMSEEKVVFLINNDLKSDLISDEVPFEILYENETFLLVTN